MHNELASRIRLVDHPIVAHRVTLLRDEQTEPSAFRQLLGEVAALVAFEALADLPTETRTVRLPSRPRRTALSSPRASCSCRSFAPASAWSPRSRRSSR